MERKRRKHRNNVRNGVLILLIIILGIGSIRNVMEAMAASEGAEIEPVVVEPVKPLEPIPPTDEPVAVEPLPSADEPEEEEDPDPAVEILQSLGYREEIPLPYKLQIALYDACKVTGCDYALALAVVEQETDFRNIMGDNGDAYGYMQVHPKWHRDRMKKYAVTDLMDPRSNFLVGCDYLSECVQRRGDYQQGLTLYNAGHWTGANNGYSREAITLYYKWDAIVGELK